MQIVRHVMDQPIGTVSHVRQTNHGFITTLLQSSVSLVKRRPQEHFMIQLIFLVGRLAVTESISVSTNVTMAIYLKVTVATQSAI